MLHCETRYRDVNYHKTVCVYWLLLTYTHYSRNFSAGAVGDDGDVIIRPDSPTDSRVHETS